MGRIWLIIFLVSIVMAAIRAIRRARITGAYGRGPNPWERRQAPGSATDSRARSPYDILGVQPGASDDEITAAYHRLVQMYHPDRVANLAPEFRDLAESRMKEINAAYDRFKRGNS